MIYVLSLTQQYIYYIILMATTFCHNGHHQVISQKLKKNMVHRAHNRQFICDRIYVYINIY